jgi:hypothetical protein
MDAKKKDTLTLFTGLRPERSHSGAGIKEKKGEIRSIFQLVLAFSGGTSSEWF